MRPSKSMPRRSGASLPNLCQGGFIYPLRNVEPMAEQSVQLWSERQDKPLNFGLLQNTKDSQHGQCLPAKFAPACQFIHDHQVGRDFVSQDDGLALTHSQTNPQRLDSGRISDCPRLDPRRIENLPGSGPTPTLYNHFVVNRGGNEDALVKGISKAPTA